MLNSKKINAFFFFHLKLRGHIVVLKTLIFITINTDKKVNVFENGILFVFYNQKDNVNDFTDSTFLRVHCINYEVGNGTIEPCRTDSFKNYWEGHPQKEMNLEFAAQFLPLGFT